MRLKFGVLLVLAAIACAPPAARANPLERVIEQAKPCARLKISKFGVSVGLDTFESAEVERLKIDADAARAKIDFIGALACRTSDSALLKGDARAKFQANLDLDLATCQFRDNTIRVLSTGGSLAVALDAAKGEVEKALEVALDRAAKSLCR
jgi:hypothetical protein